VTASDSIVDNRRLVVRVSSHYILAVIADLADRLGFDMIETLIYTGVWTANTEHLLETTGRYARLLDLPPDSLRKPIGEAELMRRLRLPREVFEPCLEQLIARGYVERGSAGLVAPSAVFTRPEMIEALGACYEGVAGLVETLRRIGLDDAA
jgi:hypothetical protein